MEQIYFANEPVTFNRTGKDDVVVRCKGTLGLYSQLKRYVDKKPDVDGSYPYGIKNKEPMEISKCRILPHHVEIACLTGTEEQFNIIINKCKSLLI